MKIKTLKMAIIFGLLTWCIPLIAQQNEVQQKGSIPPHLIRLAESDGTPAHLGQLLGVVDYGDGDSLVSFIPLYFLNDSTLKIGNDTVALKSDLETMPPGITLNPTDNYLPERSNATTFIDSKVRTVGTGTVFEDADHGIRLEDGQIRPHSNADTDTLALRVTKINAAKLNSQTDNTTNDAILNALGNANGDKIVGFDSNNGTGELSVTQRSASGVDLQIKESGNLKHDLQTNGDVYHSGTMSIGVVDSQTTAITKILTHDGDQVKFADPNQIAGSSDWDNLTNVPAGFADDVDDDTQLTESEVDAFVSDNGYLTNEVDGSVTNELQTVSKSGSTVTLSDGGGSFTDDDTQLTESEVDAFVSNNGYLANEVDGSVTNELQTVSKSGSTVTLSDGGGSFTDDDTQLTINSTNNYMPVRTNANGFVDSHVRQSANHTVFENTDHGIRIADGNIKLNSGADTDTLKIEATNGVFAQINSQSDNVNNDAVLNAHAFTNGTQIFGADSNNGLGEIKITQRSLSEVDFQVYAVGALVHELDEDGNAYHSGTVDISDDLTVTGNISSGTASIISSVIQTPLEVQGSYHGFAVMQAPNAGGNAGFKLENIADDNDSWMIRRSDDGDLTIAHSNDQPFGSETVVMEATDEVVRIFKDIVLDQGQNVRIITGSGTPEGNVIAGVGSTYHRNDGDTGTSFYVKESGVGNTGWTAK